MVTLTMSGDYEVVSRSDSIDDASEASTNSGDSEIPTPVSWSLYRYVGCAALNSCTLGYDMGVNTSASLLVKDSLNLSDGRIELFVAALDFFAMIGAANAHVISDRCGRKGLFAISATGFVTGCLLMASAGSYTSLMTGRAFVGLCVGFGLGVDPVYISEVSPPDRRGELVSWSEIAINIGIIFGFFSGLWFHKLPEEVAWRWMLGCGSALPLLMLTLLCWPGCVPESPRWLVQTHRIQEARSVLQTIYTDFELVDREIKRIQDSIEQDMEAEQALGWNFLLRPTPAYRRMLLVGVGSAVAQQLAGIDAIGAFLGFVLKDLGITSRLHQALVLIGLQVLKVIAVVIASKLIDGHGRRFLVQLSLGGVTIALLVLAANFSEETLRYTWVGVGGLALYLVAFSVGLGPLAWLIPSEVFSNTVRAKAMSLATFLNRLVGSLMDSVFLTLGEDLGWSGVFLLLASICATMWVWFYLYVPETKGKRLEDMTRYFAEVTGDTSILEMEATFHEEAVRYSDKIDDTNDAKGTPEGTVEMMDLGRRVLPDT